MWHRILSSSWIRLSYFNLVGVEKCVVIVILIIKVQVFLFSLDYTFNESLHYDERELTPT